jgi:hypothetical protein
VSHSRQIKRDAKHPWSPDLCKTCPVRGSCSEHQYYRICMNYYQVEVEP